ncbi:hypothetical protein U1Q18_045025, partial [Sarracenia purpurea var. burkii]
VFNKKTLIVEESVHVVFDKANLGFSKDLCEDDLLILEKGIDDIFIKENMEPNHEEASNSHHTAVQQLPDAEIAENSTLPKEW